MANHVLPRRAPLLAGLAACSLFCAALVAARMARTDTITFSFLLWNVILAWVPLLLSMFVVDHSRPHHKRVRLAAVFGLGVVWLLFYPNASYILTDFFHLQQRHGVPLWYDLLVIGSCAWTGLMLGFVSLFWIQQVLTERVGATYAWIAVVVVNFLTGFGVYLGRFARWNSWDVFVRPGSVLDDVWARLSDPLQNASTWGMSVGFGLFLSLAYLVVFLLMGQQHAHRTR